MKSNVIKSSFFIELLGPHGTRMQAYINLRGNEANCKINVPKNLQHYGFFSAEPTERNTHGKDCYRTNAASQALFSARIQASPPILEADAVLISY